MTELIKIEKNEKGIDTVNARELYDFLEYDKGQWSRWVKKNIVEDEFFEADLDYVTFDIVSNGNKTVNFAITLDMAKELSMLARNEKGKEARRYFIACEKKLQEKSISNQPSYMISDEIERAKVWIKEREEKQLLEKQLEVDKPKVEFYNDVTGSPDTIEMSEVAKILSIPKLGRNKLFEFLRRANVLRDNNQPYQKYVDSGYFRLIEQKYTKPNGDVHINIKTVVYQSGVDYIRKVLKRHNIF